MDYLDDILYDTIPSEIARMMFFGDFNPNHNYFEFDGYGNLKSYDDFEYHRKMAETINGGLEDYLERNI